MDNNKVYDASLDAEMEDRSHIETIRDNSNSMQIGDKTVGKITSYKFKILIKDKEPLIGEFTREEMDLIYRLYSAEGSSLTQRTVSRYFPNYTFQDFKRILRAFSITKASSPVAPHLLEEKSTEDLIQLTLQGKENDYLRKLEQDRTRLTEVRLKEMTEKYHKIRNKFAKVEDIIGIDLSKKLNLHTKPTLTNEKSIIIYLSDIHVGAYNDSYGTYENPYNEDVIISRFKKILNKINASKYNNIIVMNLGDSVDSYKKETSRGGHELPSLMNDKEQSKLFLKVMYSFFSEIISTNQNSKVFYYCVGESNHDADWGWINNVALSNIISNIGVASYVSERPIDYFDLGNKTFVYMHGKNNYTQFKGFPLTLDQKTEIYMNEYLDENGITPDKKVYVIKGDLHQSAITKSRRFVYHSVASIYGSSNWITSNFGFTKWGCDYSVISEDGDLMDGVITD